jgi:hypothetical protein
MISVEYPWRWLADGVGATFFLRYPWMDAIQRAARTGERVCLLLPEAAGPLTDWREWLTELIGRDNAAPCLVATGDFRDITQTLAASYQVAENGFVDGRPADWARKFLPACRRLMPHGETVPVVVVGADDACAGDLADLVAAQRSLGYPFVRPLLLRRTVPLGWGGEVIRFGLPQPVGDLHSIYPTPERDVAFWTILLLALTVSWEAGAVPRLADELWEQLRLGRTLSLRDGGFDAWLERQLNEFSARNLPGGGLPLPEALAFGPSAVVEDGLWQEGSVAWQDGLFDVTPLRARLWIEELPDDAREALRCRRLTNVPLARWLSAWGTSIEESLRVAALQAGGRKFRRYLQAQPPRNRRDAQARSRWEGLSPPDDVAAIDGADFGDLVAFVARSWPAVKRSHSLATLLEQCRLARNRVVHERRLSARDLLHITRVVDWLSEEGLM